MLQGFRERPVSIVVALPLGALQFAPAQQAIHLRRITLRPLGEHPTEREISSAVVIVVVRRLAGK